MIWAEFEPVNERTSNFLFLDSFEAIVEKNQAWMAETMSNQVGIMKMDWGPL